MSKVPLLNEVVELAFTFSSASDAAGTTATILLPNTVTLVSGDLEWAGDLKAGDLQTLEAAIRFTQQGNWTIEARASSALEGGDSWGDAAYIYLYVSEKSSHIGFDTNQPPLSTEQNVPTPPSIDPSP